jgi:hypothetical protein
MPLSYTVEPEHRLLVVTAVGPVGRPDMDQLRAQLLADDRIVAGTRMLWETTQGQSRLSFVDLKDIAARLKGIFDKGISKVAIVATSHLIYSLATTFGVFARFEPVEVKPFRNLEDAKRWLKCEEDAAVPAGRT